jgi:uncharacterized protein (DUF302 family)
VVTCGLAPHPTHANADFAVPRPAAARAADDGLVTRPSKHTVAETTDHLEAGLRQAGATVFARIDYAQSAHDNGLELNPMVLILFGNPKAGTPLMARSRTIGVDLPLKFVVWQDGSGKVFISFNSADHLAHTLLPRHGITQMPELLNRGVDLADKLSAAEGD